MIPQSFWWAAGGVIVLALAAVEWWTWKHPRPVPTPHQWRGAWLALAAAMGVFMVSCAVFGPWGVATVVLPLAAMFRLQVVWGRCQFAAWRASGGPGSRHPLPWRAER